MSEPVLPTSRRGVIWVLIATIGLLVLLPSMLGSSLLYDVASIAIMGMFAVSYNLLFGYGGYLSFGHAAYFGVGAYVTALLMKDTDWATFYTASLLATLASCTLGTIIGSACVRRKGAYFAMLTLAYGMLIYEFARNWRTVTGGDNGLGDFLPKALAVPFIGEVPLGGIPGLYYIIITIALLVFIIAWCLMTFTPYGNAVKACRSNEQRTEFIGYNVFLLKLTNYAIACALAGLAGSLFALLNNFVSTPIMGLDEDTKVVMMVFIGGTTYYLGPIIGAIFFIWFGDILSSLTNYAQLIMGVLFVVIIMTCPRGLTGLLEDCCKLLYYKLLKVNAEHVRRVIRTRVSVAIGRFL